MAPTPIKLALVRAGLEAVQRHIDTIPSHLDQIRADIETGWTERERCLFISQQCIDVRGALETALRAINAIDKDAQQYLNETDPK